MKFSLKKLLRPLVSLIVYLFSLTLYGQNGLDLKYFNNPGITVGVDDNRFTHFDYRIKDHNFSFSNTLFVAPLKEQFINLSYFYSYNIGKFDIYPTINFSTNFLSGELQLSSPSVEIPVLWKKDILSVFVKPGYSGTNGLLYSTLIAIDLSKDLCVFGSYGNEQSFTFLTKSLSFGFMYLSDKVKIKSGIQIPEVKQETYVRLLTSFTYSLGSRHTVEK